MLSVPNSELVSFSGERATTAVAARDRWHSRAAVGVTGRLLDAQHLPRGQPEHQGARRRRRGCDRWTDSGSQAPRPFAQEIVLALTTRTWLVVHQLPRKERCAVYSPPARLAGQRTIRRDD